VAYRGLRLVLSLRGVQTRNPLPSGDERACTDGLGALRCERDRGSARFTTRKSLGEPLDIAWGLFVLPRTREFDCTLDVSVASSEIAERSVSDRNDPSKAAEIAPTRLLVKGRRASSIRDAFHRQEPHTHRARAEATYASHAVFLRRERSRDEDRSSLEEPLVLSPP